MSTEDDSDRKRKPWGWIAALLLLLYFASAGPLSVIHAYVPPPIQGLIEIVFTPLRITKYIDPTGTLRKAVDTYINWCHWIVYS